MLNVVMLSVVAPMVQLQPNGHLNVKVVAGITTFDFNIFQPADDDKCCVLLTCAGDADEDDPEGPCKGIEVSLLTQPDPPFGLDKSEGKKHKKIRQGMSLPKT